MKNAEAAISSRRGGVKSLRTGGEVKKIFGLGGGDYRFGWGVLLLGRVSTPLHAMEISIFTLVFPTPYIKRINV